MKLSVVVLFCDKDVKFLYDFLRQLESHIFTDYEIILVDNREKDKTEIKTKYKLIDPGENIYLFEGRRIGFENSSGEYIWFVDVDDEIIGDVYDEDFSSNADFIQFYYDANGAQIKPGNYPSVKAFGYNVWSRFYKASKLKEAYAPITKRGIKVSTFENAILLSLMLRTKPTISYLDKILYKYNLCNSTFHKKSLSKEEFDRFTKGYDILPYLFSFCEDGNELMKKRERKFEALTKKLTKI